MSRAKKSAIHDMELCFENGVRGVPEVLYRVVTGVHKFGRTEQIVNWFASHKRVTQHIEYTTERSGNELMSVSEYRLTPKGPT
jgi:hypothetical protein